MKALTVQNIIRESLPLLVLLCFLEVIGGRLLDVSMETFIALPVLLAAVPLINGLGGNLGSVLGARVSSALHTGYMKASVYDENMRKNVLEAISLGLFLFLFFSVFMPAMFLFTGRETFPLLRVALILFVTGLLLTLIVVCTGVLSAIISFRFGVDPDNVVVPIITTLADLSGIIILLTVINLAGI